MSEQTTTVREFAERVLFGARLADKLAAPTGPRRGSLNDGDPGVPITLPQYPTRPAGLGLRPSKKGSRHRLPRVSELDRADQRGRMLHFFANHELLALELMALTLLRFPDAPAAFRRGVVLTMAEEQDHLTQYIDRMGECGVSFGEHPVNDFFWHHLRHIRGPMDYVVHMNLMFEQANLDYSRYYERAFRQAGDIATAEVLKRVYEDEIGHVKSGLVWFRRWKDPCESDWEGFRTRLRAPMSPSRAKGLGFDREGRLKAGLTSSFINDVEMFTQSKGRPPAVFWFNPTCDEEIHRGLGYNPNRLVGRLVRDLAVLPMYLAAADDVVHLPAVPSKDFLSDVRTAGFRVPELVSGEAAWTALSKRKLAQVRPWGWSPTAARRAECLNSALIDPQLALRWTSNLRPVFGKAWASDQLRAFGKSDFAKANAHWLDTTESAGQTATSVPDARLCVRELLERGCSVLLKANFSASGRHRVQVDAWDDDAAAWVDKTLLTHGKVVVEPYLDRHVDLSIHVDIDTEGGVQQHGISRFYTTRAGRYIGAALGRRFDDCSAETKALVYGNGREPRRLRQLAVALGDLLGPRLRDVGYWGPVGIDAMIFRDISGSLRLKPIVEINARTTMGRVALALESRLWRGRAGYWRQFTTAELKRRGFASGASFASRVRACFPLETRHSPALLLSSGAFFTSDPKVASTVVTVLLVGTSLQQCVRGLETLSLDAEGAG